MTKFQWELRFIFFSGRRTAARKLSLALFIMATVLTLSCDSDKPPATKEVTAAGLKQAKKWDRADAEREYRLLQHELAVAKSDKPYIVFDFAHGELLLKLQAAEIWSCPMQFPPREASNLKEFVERFRGKENHYIRPLMGKYLFAAKGQLPESVLTIVSDVVKVPVDRLQREVPERFLLQWDDNLVLEISSGVAGKATSKFQNALFEIRSALAGPLGETSIILRLDPDKAMTLYRATIPGMPTLVYPPS